MKKRIKKLIIFVTLTMIITLCETYAYAVDDYPQEYKTPAVDTVIDRWNFYNRECTSFVAWCLNSRNGVTFSNQYGGVERWGHAKDWGATARGLGIAVDSNPKPGSVAWSGEGYYGHVAWVASVNGNDVSIEEYNNGSPNYSERTIKKWEFQYIHIKDLCNSHKWDAGVVTRKSKHTKSELINGEKTYTCTVCGEKKTEVVKVSHSFKKTKTKKATLKTNGKISKKCTKCGKTTYTKILRPKTVKMKKSLVAYNGKKQMPVVVIKDLSGKTIPKGNYKVSYLNNKKIGTATAIVTFKGNYSGTKKLSFKIGPKGSVINKIAGGQKKITVRWTRRSGINGYQVQYATRKDFKGGKTVTIKNNKKVSTTISKLKNGTTYYARVRTYKKIKKKNYYSPWSTIKSAKTTKAASYGRIVDKNKLQNGFDNGMVGAWIWVSEDSDTPNLIYFHKDGKRTQWSWWSADGKADNLSSGAWMVDGDTIFYQSYSGGSAMPYYYDGRYDYNGHTEVYTYYDNYYYTYYAITDAAYNKLKNYKKSDWKKLDLSKLTVK